MANEIIELSRNVAEQGQVPIWERWFPKVVAQSVMMSASDNESKTIVDYVREQIANLIGSAPEAYDTLQEIAEYITAHQEVADALNEAITKKADKTVASQSQNGLMSAADKKKLDGVATNANNYTHPSSSGNKHIPSGGSSGKILGWSSDGTAVWQDPAIQNVPIMKGATASVAGTAGLVPAPAAGQNNKYLKGDGTFDTPENTTYNEVTQSQKGLMSVADKKKLDGIASNANNYVHPETHTATMIVEDTNHRFVKDSDKTNWDNKPTIQFGTEYPSDAPANSIFGLIR